MIGVEFSRIPERILPYMDTIQVTNLGEHITFASAPFANPMPQEEVLRRYLSNYVTNNKGNIFSARPDIKKIKGKLMRNLGITHRYESPPLSETRTLADVVDESATIGALLVQKIMQEKGWNTIDFLMVGSATLPDLSAQVLEKTGLQHHDVFTTDDHVECADSVVQFINALTNPALRGKNGIIFNTNPLSYLQHPRHFYDQLAIGILFGDQHIAWGFNTADFIPHSWHITFVPDGGTIYMQTGYEVPKFDPSVIPAHLQNHISFIEKNGVDPRTRVSITERGIRMSQSDPSEINQNLPAYMNNDLTGSHFIEVTPNVFLDIIESFYRENPAATLAYGIIHDPSLLVSLGIMRKTMHGADKRGIPKPFIKPLFAAGFLLGEMQCSNSAGSTPPKKFQYMAEQNMIHPEGYFFLGAPGVGSTVAGIIAEYVPK